MSDKLRNPQEIWLNIGCWVMAEKVGPFRMHRTPGHEKTVSLTPNRSGGESAGFYPDFATARIAAAELAAVKGMRWNACTDAAILRSPKAALAAAKAIRDRHCVRSEEDPS